MIFSKPLWYAAFGCLSFSADAYSAPVTWMRNAFPLPESIWSVEALDANGDGRLDLIAMGETKVFALTAPEWKPHVLIDTKEPKMLYCVAFDADRDGDLDIAVGRYQVPWINYRQARESGKTVNEPKGPDFSVAWLENTRALKDPWPLHVIDRELNGIHGIWKGDVNGDGDRDVAAASFTALVVRWFENDGKGSFSAHDIDIGNKQQAYDLKTADLDADGRLDLLLAGRESRNAVWYSNRSQK
jgi:VCBS repeat protein